MSQPRRFRNVLSLQEKLAVLTKIAEGRTFASLAREYSVSLTSIRSVKKSEAKIMAIGKLVADPVATRTCLRRDTDVEKMEQLLLARIDEAERKGRPYKPLRARREALEIMRRLNPSDVKFRATKGWYQRFRKRFRRLDDDELVAKFAAQLRATLADEAYSAERVYNLGAVTLQWKPGESTGVLLCGNSTGEHKLPPHFDWDSIGFITWLARELKRDLLLVEPGLAPELPDFRVLEIPTQIAELVSPTSQGQATMFKLHYYRRLAEDLQESGRTWEELGQVRAAELAREAWAEIKGETLRASWNRALEEPTKDLREEKEALKESIVRIAEVAGGKEMRETVERLILDCVGERVEETMSDDLTVNSCTTEDSVDTAECKVFVDTNFSEPQPSSSRKQHEEGVTACDVKSEVDVEETVVVADSSERTNQGRYCDDFELFGELVARKIRRLPTRYAQCTVQHLINNVLYEAELGVYDRPS